MKKRMFCILFAALFAVLLLPAAAFALPQGGRVLDGGKTQEIIGNVLNINGFDVLPVKGTGNTVLYWDSFDIANDEIVQFDNGENTNNYLCLVHDNKPSVIEGTITGGNNIYIINPNGVIFGKNSIVNVGDLYVSTRSLDGSDWSTYVDNTGNLKSTATVGGNITNLSSIQADKVCLEGSDVVLGLDSLNSASTEIRAKGDIKCGVKQTPDQTLTAQVATLSARCGLASKNLQGEVKNVTPYWWVRNVYELQNMRNDLTGNYMLAQNIDALSLNTPIGSKETPFIGEFNSNGYRVNNLLNPWLILPLPHTHGQGADAATFETAWTDSTSLPTETGSYYLTTDVTLDSTWTVPSGDPVNLCLNGHVIRMADEKNSASLPFLQTQR